MQSVPEVLYPQTKFPVTSTLSTVNKLYQVAPQLKPVLQITSKIISFSGARMNPITEVNVRVSVVSISHAEARDTVSYVPYKMKYQNREIVFTQLGMRHPTEKGKRMIHVFDVSDEANDYRLEFDAERLTWTLVSIMEGRYVR
jgi:hypothetical protein